MHNFNKQLFSLALIIPLLTGTISADALSSLQKVEFTGLTADVLLAEDSIHADENVSGIVTSDIHYAINGGFFNSYYDAASAITFPNNSPRIYGAIVKDGQLINGTGQHNMFAVNYDGSILIDRITCSPFFVINESQPITPWAINQLYTDSTSITVMTDDFNMNFSVPQGAEVLTVSNGIVTEISSQTLQYVSDNTFKIVYNSGAALNGRKWDTMPNVGDKIELSATFTAQNGTADNIKTAVAGGRLLVKNYANVSYDSNYNSSFDSDPKQSNSSSAQRSFAGVYPDGRVILGTASGTFPEIADYLIGLGVIDAISLDGGASSMLYSSNSGYLTNAGRQLASVLAFMPSTGTEEKPEPPSVVTPPPTVGTNTPSSWAIDGIKQAEAFGIIPEWLLTNYTSPITRQEFCELMVTFITQKTGKSVDEYRQILGVSYTDPYSDTDSYHILSMSALGVVNGTGDGKFSPNEKLTREQAATMIYRLVNILGTVDQSANPSFNDYNKISSYAVEAVDFVTSAKIMNGTGENFDPQGTYTREQAFITMLGVYNNLTTN